MAIAHVYQRDNVNTDEIIPARYLNTDNVEELASHCMEDLDPDFMKKAKAGDVVVCGEDFGCGSSREHAVWAIQGAKLSAVIANSFARIFYRNCIDCGFYPIELPDANKVINDGDDIDIDFKAGIIKSNTQDKEIEFKPLPDFALKIIEDGGLLDHIAKK
ncbi:2,3-dimethylmalate dehydratase small subunit [Limihaloglobus sulfuriphilus]|uniref:3-isopropylmalate dehydratase small subunit n=1 Tax=Limihaloglobus sulfuriphilus TaxID=1851148 RepID=A0A1Q2MD67_9BACT|nr:3-isopropylmalate dehydratase small subunit [Limihaloglobus sulfuriphilus]AQQ70643.1 2,3-dimethylmalate dehydratase small subunit [Limihaloglobus sulfuriphilus]